MLTQYNLSNFKSYSLHIYMFIVPNKLFQNCSSYVQTRYHFKIIKINFRIKCDTKLFTYLLNCVFYL